MTVVKWRVTDLKDNWESNVTMNLYHTNQGIHFQGGSRKGARTSCSLAANILELWCQKLMKVKATRISEIRETLMNLDLRKRFGSQPLKKKKKQEEEETYKCDNCHYKTVSKSELKRHTYLTHQKRPHPTKMKTVTFKTNKDSKEEQQWLADVECLKCRFSCREEKELDNHMLNVHKKEDQEKEQGANTILTMNADRNALVRENSMLRRTHFEKEKYLGLLKGKEQEYITTIALLEKQVKDLICMKSKTEESYQEASRVIAEIQRTNTAQSEKLKVLENIQEVEKEEMQLRQRKISVNTDTPSVQAPTPNLSPDPTLHAPGPGEGEESGEWQVAGGLPGTEDTVDRGYQYQGQHQALLL